MIPDMDCFSICQQIREKHNFPVIILTAKEEEIDKITGLTLCADDYITKPFRSLELTSSYSSLKMTPNSSGSISPDKLNSSNAILICLKDHAILMQKDSEEKIYPASLTKMMTALVAIENLPSVQKEIRLTHYTFDSLNSADASVAGFGLCLASLAKVGKQKYILISAGAKGDHHSEQHNITDALAVYNSLRK